MFLFVVIYRSLQKLLFVRCGLLAEHILLVRVALRRQSIVIVAQQRGNSFAAAFVFLKEGQQVARYRVHLFAEQTLLRQVVGHAAALFADLVQLLRRLHHLFSNIRIVHRAGADVVARLGNLRRSLHQRIHEVARPLVGTFHHPAQGRAVAVGAIQQGIAQAAHPILA